MTQENSRSERYSFGREEHIAIVWPSAMLRLSHEEWSDFQQWLQLVAKKIERAIAPEPASVGEYVPVQSCSFLDINGLPCSLPAGHEGVHVGVLWSDPAPKCAVADGTTISETVCDDPF